MNKLISFAAALLLFSSGFVNAATTHDHTPTEKAPATKAEKLAPDNTANCPKMGMGGGMGMSGMGMGMMGGMGAGMPADFKQKMMEQMAAIRQTSDPAERQKLMQEHFQSMQEAMQNMRSGSSAMGGCSCRQHCPQAKSGKSMPMGGNCARAAAQGTSSASPANGSGMSGAIEQRMDMMQTMMENMLEHQRLMQQNK